VGGVDEVLTDNAILGLQGALWELDQDIATLATDEARLVAVVAGFAEQLMAKVALRAQTAARAGDWQPRVTERMGAGHSARRCISHVLTAEAVLMIHA
jgi:F0F1-type ATP synthase epsilon subunit